jgi:hypothetical protein
MGVNNPLFYADSRSEEHFRSASEKRYSLPKKTFFQALGVFWEKIIFDDLFSVHIF